MGLDTYLDLEVKNKETGELSEFSILYLRKCYSITDKMEDILRRSKAKIINEDYYEYPITEVYITKALLECLIEEENKVRRHCVNLYLKENEDNFTYESVWSIEDYPRIISKEVNNLTDFFLWLCVLSEQKNVRDMEFFDPDTYVKMENYDWNTAIIKFCASW